MNYYMAERGGAFMKILAVIGIIAFLAVMMLGLYLDPTKTWVKQNRELGTLQQRYQESQNRNNELRKEQQELMSDEYIEKKAREELGLIKPGEEAYVVVDPPVVTPPPAPETKAKESFIDRLKRLLLERNIAVTESGE